MSTMHRNPAARRGITLIELIVVIALLSILATLVALYIVPAFQDNRNVVRGVDRVTTALLIAKQRALRDQAPRGVRFITTSIPIFPVGIPNQGGQHVVIQQLQYIEQPDPYTGGQLNGKGPGAAVQGATVLRFSNFVPPTAPPPFTPTSTVDFIGGADIGSTTEYEVQPGDYFSYSGSNYQIKSIIFPNRRTWLQLVRGLDFTINVPTDYPTPYQIIRQTRPISGEKLIDMPNNVVIYNQPVPPTAPIVSFANVQIPNGQFPSPPGNFEILFDPAGGVMNRGGSTPIVIVIFDPTADNPMDANSARVLTIYPRTGSVVANPIGPAGNLLQYALSGSPSGL